MDFIHVLILGVVEGITEFLPVSSTGHLIVASKWLGLPQDANNFAFEIIIQFAAILAVVANYTSYMSFKYVSLWWKVFLAFLPLAAIGFIFDDFIKTLFSVEVVAVMFIVGGVVFLIVEYFYKEKAAHTTKLEKVSYKQALWIGVAQVCALVPGTSRAGATIIGALLVGLDRKTSAEFSFLLALPVMGAVSAYTFLKHYDDFSNADLIALACGFLVSFLVAFIAMRLLLAFLARFTFVAFGIYRILFGLLLLAVM